MLLAAVSEVRPVEDGLVFMTARLRRFYDAFIIDIIMRLTITY